MNKEEMFKAGKRTGLRKGIIALSDVKGVLLEHFKQFTPPNLIKYIETQIKFLEDESK